MANVSDDSAMHRKFSAGCFNAAWDLMDKESRTTEEEMTMLLRSASSLWHWTEREDCKLRNLSIGYWQLSRVFALMNEGSMARKAGEACLNASPIEDHFCRGYAHEAIARAALVSGDKEEAEKQLAEAMSCLERIKDDEERQALKSDLDSISV